MQRLWLFSLMIFAGCGDLYRNRSPHLGTVDLGALTVDGSTEPDLSPPPDLTPSACRGGRYEGVFSGTISGVSYPLSGPAIGSVSLVLGQPSGEFFTIGDGHMTGTATVPGITGTYPYSADLTGTLNCSSLMLENGKLENGKVLVMGTTFLFTGPIDATYNPGAQTLSGTWNGKESSNLAVGNGNWSVTYTGPN